MVLPVCVAAAHLQWLLTFTGCTAKVLVAGARLHLAYTAAHAATAAVLAANAAQLSGLAFTGLRVHRARCSAVLRCAVLCLAHMALAMLFLAVAASEYNIRRACTGVIGHLE